MMDMPHGIQEVKREEGARVLIFTSKGTLPMTQLPSTRFHLIRVPKLPNCAIGSHQAFSIQVFGHI
jgi:hypothetical protein